MEYLKCFERAYFRFFGYQTWWILLLNLRHGRTFQFVNYREKWQSLWSLKNKNDGHAVITNKGDKGHCEKLTKEAKATPGKKPPMYVSTTENTNLVSKYTVTFPAKYCVLCGRVCTFLYLTNLLPFFPLYLS